VLLRETYSRTTTSHTCCKALLSTSPFRVYQSCPIGQEEFSSLAPLDCAKKQSISEYSITRWKRPRKSQLDLFIDLANDICRHICLTSWKHPAFYLGWRRFFYHEVLRYEHLPQLLRHRTYTTAETSLPGTNTSPGQIGYCDAPRHLRSIQTESVVARVSIAYTQLTQSASYVSRTARRYLYDENHSQ
jgi:hypothetical protein